MSAEAEAALKCTPLERLHRKLGARMVPFAGYLMPLQYSGIIEEHRHARQRAVLFDVSHMGQALVTGDNVLAAMERLVVADLQGMQAGRLRYTLLTNDGGGIIDDIMVAHGGTTIWLILNASRAEVDLQHIGQYLGSSCALQPRPDRALLALQGPAAATVLGRFAPAARLMLFMTVTTLSIDGIKCGVSRSGYTGEDGYEISLAADAAEHVAHLLLGEPEVKPAGLGARDTLRLEAGLCLYGNDIDTTTTPVEASLAWTINKRRRLEGGFPGAEVIQAQLQHGVAQKRVGIRLDGKAPARAHTPITSTDGQTIGHVTSGGFAPSLQAPIAMGYVARAFATPGTLVNLIVRDKPLPGRVVSLPFVEHRYAKPA